MIHPRPLFVMMRSIARPGRFVQSHLFGTSTPPTSGPSHSKLAHAKVEAVPEASGSMETPKKQKDSSTSSSATSSATSSSADASRKSRTEVRDSDYEYCEDLVKKSEYEAWFIGHHYGPHQRAFFALYALHCELNYVWLKADNAEAQEKRLLFWKTAVMQLFDGKVEPTPILRALHQTVQRYPALDRMHLRRMVHTRLQHVRVQQPRNLEYLGHYIDGTTTSLLLLLMQVFGAKGAKEEQAIASLGKAMGVVNLMHFTPYFHEKRRTFLPADLCAKEKLSEEAMYRYGTDADQPSTTSAISQHPMQKVIFVLANEAHNHIVHLRSLPVSPVVHPILMHTVTCETYLDRLKRYEFDPYDQRLHNNRAQLAFLFKMLKNRITRTPF